MGKLFLAMRNRKYIFSCNRDFYKIFVVIIVERKRDLGLRALIEIDILSIKK